MGWGLCTSREDGCWVVVLGSVFGVAGLVFVMADKI